MFDKQTALMDPKNPKADPRRFAFDYSYWSHSGYEVADNGYFEPKDPRYTDQVLYLLMSFLTMDSLLIMLPKLIWVSGESFPGSGPWNA